MGEGLAGCGTGSGTTAARRVARARSVFGHCLALWSGGLPRPAARSQTDLWADRTTAHLSPGAAALNEVIRAAAALQDVCDSEGWRYCFIGGLAVQRWGEPRETVDVDLTLLTGFTDEIRFVATLLRHYQPRIDRALEFARDNRVLLLKAPSGVGLDIALGGLPFEELAVSRSSLFTFPPNVPLRTCSAEDLVVLKAFADRPKDWVDVEGILIRQSDRMDWAHVRRQLGPLVELKEAPEILDRLERRRIDLER